MKKILEEWISLIFLLDHELNVPVDESHNLQYSLQLCLQIKCIRIR